MGNFDNAADKRFGNIEEQFGVDAHPEYHDDYRNQNDGFAYGDIGERFGGGFGFAQHNALEHPQHIDGSENDGQSCKESQIMIVFEDAEAGVEAALRAGMKCIGIGSPVQLGKAHLVVPSLDKLKFEQLFAL